MDIKSAYNCAGVTGNSVAWKMCRDDTIPRKYRHSKYTIRPYFLGEIVAVRKYCRTYVGSVVDRHSTNARLQKSSNYLLTRWNKPNTIELWAICIVTGSFPTSMTKTKRNP